ncbi:MAG: 50S ribosomal protein L32 [Chloroflexi bacterium]|nr:50S ribosomal protein L32 [Chloroflexota bacterium]GIW10624.1 MAG: 50S ribosomal protein L32 [Dehalococcoidia bacterium]
MAVPKKKTPRSYRGSRRSHHHLKVPAIQPCPQCRQPMAIHRVCPACGWYHGREAVPPKAEAARGR